MKKDFFLEKGRVTRRWCSSAAASSDSWKQNKGLKMLNHKCSTRLTDMTTSIQKVATSFFYNMFIHSWRKLKKACWKHAALASVSVKQLQSVTSVQQQWDSGQTRSKEMERWDGSLMVWSASKLNICCCRLSLIMSVFMSSCACCRENIFFFSFCTRTASLCYCVFGAHSVLTRHNSSLYFPYSWQQKTS